MSEHTPGPWKAVGVAEVVEAKDGKTVALAYGPVDRELDVAIPNARLIAAAPDLLEAAEWALVELEAWIEEELRGTSMYEDHMAKLDRLREPIARVRGEDL